jgi:hypothetical protein
MSDIFLSYASADLLRVQPLIRALERQGWSVWWDRSAILPGQNFDQVIEEALGAARCILVVWSRASIVSNWVKAEATEGRRRRVLVPVTLDDIQIPLGFSQIQTARLLDWQDTGAYPEFDKVIRAVTNLLGTPPAEGATVPAVRVPTPQPPGIQPGGEVPPTQQKLELGKTGEVAGKDKAKWSRRGKLRLVWAIVVTGSDSRRLGEYAWYTTNVGGQPQPVGQLKPNAWGLYDIHGNVSEWVQGWYGKYPVETVTDPQGPEFDSYRVFRGGGWSDDDRHCRSAERGGNVPGHRDADLGFRLLRTVQ